MRVGIKGGGGAVLVTLVALLCAGIFYKLSRSDEGDMTVPLIGGLPLALMRIATDESAATLNNAARNRSGRGRRYHGVCGVR